MASEGEFPKIDGDVLFASEANRFASAGRFVGIGSFAAIGSATAKQDIGSVVIPAGSLSNPCSLVMDLVYLRTGGDSADQLTVQLSGLSKNSQLTIGSGNVWGGGEKNLICAYRGIIGSPFTGFHRMIMFSADESDNKVNQTTTTSAQNFNNINTGSELVINFKANSSNASNFATSYFIQSFGDGL